MLGSQQFTKSSNEARVSILDIKDMKKILSEDTSKIEKLLEYFGFHSFNYHDGNLRCALPDGDNITSVSIYLDETLYGVIYTRGSFKGDIFHIIHEATGRTLKDILKITSALFGFSRGLTLSSYVSHNEVVGAIMADIPLAKKKVYEEKENELYPEDKLNNYIRAVHVDLIQEGISPTVAKRFGISYDPQNNRILFPHFDWYDTDKIAGIQGRIIGLSSEECDLLGVPKYWNYIKGYFKTRNLYGWGQAKEEVMKRNQLIIFEAEKSVLKHFTFCKGKGFSVALGSHELSKEQIKFIVNNTNPDCEIIFGFDKDIMTNEVERKKAMEMMKKMALFRKVSYMEDPFPNNKLLKEKDSPVDRGYRVYNYLFASRKEI